jgi:ribA/ribD-fused uncharacterized protein
MEIILPTEIYFTKESYMSHISTSQFVDEEGIEFNCAEQKYLYDKWKISLTANSTPKYLELGQTILKEKNPKNLLKFAPIINDPNPDICIDNEEEISDYHILKRAIYYKILHNKELSKFLIETGTKVLYYADIKDNYFGIGFSHYISQRNINRDLYGCNLVGLALMEIRDKLNYE